VRLRTRGPAAARRALDELEAGLDLVGAQSAGPVAAVPAAPAGGRPAGSPAPT